MPTMANTKVRGVRVDDGLWREAQDATAAQRMTVADVVRYALGAFVVDPHATIAALAKIRGGK